MPQNNSKSLIDILGKLILKIAEEDKSMIGIIADASNRNMLSYMMERFPDRVIDISNSKQNIIAAAAGAAAVGGVVVVEAHAAEISLRAYEQIRNLIAYPRLNVKIIGKLSGLSSSYDGAVFHAMEDIGIMRCIPNMAITVPVDVTSSRVIVEEVLRLEGPTYVRLGNYNIPEVFNEGYQFEIGHANIVKRNGIDATIICSGPIVSKVLSAERILSSKGYNIGIIEMPCVKPIDRDRITEAAKETGAIITVEEHSVIGGLGSAVSEVLTDNYPVLLNRMGVQDTFTESGAYEKLLDKYSLSINSIVDSVEQIVEKKKSFYENNRGLYKK